MKKIIAILVCVVMSVALFAACTAAPAASEAPASEAPASEAPASEAPASEAPASEEPAGEVQKLSIGFYADAADSYYQVMNESLQACAAQDPACDWTVDYKVGQSTADEQLKAVEDFITAGYDAIIVIQNNVDTTSECIQKCVDAGIPYFGAAHDFSTAANAKDAAGSCCYDFIQAGVYAGDDAASREVKKVIMIEGVLGQGSAGAQTLGFLQAYEDAGKNLGGVSAVDLATKKSEAKQDGTQEIEVVFWASGNWAADPAQKAMTDAITSLGADGFDGVYVQNNPMTEGVIAAMTDAGLNPADYWIGSSNGREISWNWAKEGTITMDVNQAASLEGSTLYQQIKAYFNNAEYRKYIHPYLTPYNKDNINEVESSLIPFSDVDAFVKGMQDGTFVTDINDALFTDIEGY